MSIFNHLTPEEKTLHKLFAEKPLPAPDRALLGRILNDFSPSVTKSSTARISIQEREKGRVFTLTFLDTISMSLKRFVPIGALVMVIVATAFVASRPAKTPTANTTSTFETKISSSGPLSSMDIDATVEELTADILLEEGDATDESILLSSADEFTLNSIDQLYEL